MHSLQPPPSSFPVKMRPTRPPAWRPSISPWNAAAHLSNTPFYYVFTRLRLAIHNALAMHPGHHVCNKSIMLFPLQTSCLVSATLYRMFFLVVGILNISTSSAVSSCASTTAPPAMVAMSPSAKSSMFPHGSIRLSRATWPKSLFCVQNNVAFVNDDTVQPSRLLQSVDKRAAIITQCRLRCHQHNTAASGSDQLNCDFGTCCAQRRHRCRIS